MRDAERLRYRRRASRAFPMLPPFGCAHAACRGCQRVEASATGAEGHGGAVHGAHQQRCQNHLRPLQLLCLQHAGGLEQHVEVQL